MATSISFRIVNWKLTLLAIVMIAGLISLGVWQLNRATEKKLLISSFVARTLATPLKADALNNAQDFRYYRAQLTGHFDNDHSLLLDNKILDGMVGYEVYTPFISAELNSPILVDRGFVPIGISRNVLPPIKSAVGTVTILGMLNLPPTYVAFGGMQTDKTKSWPMRVEYVDLTKIYEAKDFYPYVLTLSKEDPAAYQIQWQAFVTMPPERHIGYAVQWFALALTLLILCVVLNRNHQRCTVDE